MNALNWIVKEAKKIKKQYPKRFATWKEYVSQASAIYSKKHGEKSPVSKNKKISGMPKKKVAKKKVAKKTNYHKDTKSHNVNIRVISGIDKNVLLMVNDYVKTIKRMEGDVESMIIARKLNKNDPFNSLERIKHKKEQISQFKRKLNKLKKAL